MEFTEFSSLMKAKQDMTQSVENYVYYLFEDGKGRFLTIKELADILKVDPILLTEYYIKYRGDINLAVLAAKNDKSLEDNLLFIKQNLGIQYLVEHNPMQVIREYNGLLGAKKRINKQLELFMLFNKNNNNTFLRITGEQLSTLMLRSNSPFENTTYFKPDESPAKSNKIDDEYTTKEDGGNQYRFASETELSAMEAIIKIGDLRFLEITDEELSNMRNTLPENVTRKVLSTAENGLLMDVETATSIYSLFTTHQISIEKNIEVFETLSSAQTLDTTLDAENAPVLSKNKPNK